MRNSRFTVEFDRVGRPDVRPSGIGVDALLQPHLTLKIGEVAAQSGVSIDTLRFYEKSGVLDKPQRSLNGYRVYDRNVLERLVFIREARSLGFTLAEIREVLSAARAGKDVCPLVRAIIRKKLHEAEEKIEEISSYRDALTRFLAKEKEKKDGVGNICGLIEDTSTSEVIGSDTRRVRLARKRSSS